MHEEEDVGTERKEEADEEQDNEREEERTEDTAKSIKPENLRRMIKADHARSCDDGVICHRGFTEHAYRLAFDFQDKYEATPRLSNLMPDGTVENEKELEPQ